MSQKGMDLNLDLFYLFLFCLIFLHYFFIIILFFIINADSKGDHSLIWIFHFIFSKFQFLYFLSIIYSNNYLIFCTKLYINNIQSLLSH